jgi:peptidoglycan hydrolase-like protein with peptidoglycan-binding domain
MEALAYTHLYVAHEDPTDIKLTNFNLKLFQEFNWSKLPVKASLRFFSLTLALVIVGLTSSAFALQTGNSGSSVAALQQDLSIAGFYKGPVTGFYGSLTKDAVIRFQRVTGLTADGIAGPRTLAALEGRGGSYEPDPGDSYSNVTLRRGSRGTDVSRLQNALAARGFYSGPITGYYGQLTETAVLRFQKSRGLLADGIVGSRTKSALSIY